MSKLTAWDKTLIASFLEENFHDFCEHLERNGATGPAGDAESFGENVVEILNEEGNE
ncbi:MAG: hypothetical protein ACRCTP_17920 [Aeromonas popoffii]|uniref:hypothetical protein n=1 Tax=Aeromonas popoffii TaxID=70856 RepID=UPI003F33BFF3